MVIKTIMLKEGSPGIYKFIIVSVIYRPKTIGILLMFLS